MTESIIGRNVNMSNESMEEIDLKHAVELGESSDGDTSMESTSPDCSPVADRPPRPSTSLGMREEANQDLVKVYCRIRPEKMFENMQGGHQCAFVANDSVKNPRHPDAILMHNTGMTNNYKFNFAKVFGPEASQLDVYSEVAEPVVEAVMNGINAAILCYGQTASGKTYTMEGPSISDPNYQGLMPRIMREVFSRIHANEEHNVATQVLVSNVEIYKEKIYDLLLENGVGKKNLKTREDKARGLWLPAGTVVKAKTFHDVFKAMKTGKGNRAVAETSMNVESSRSHSIFLVTIIQEDCIFQTTKISQLYLVDLAGSERVSKTGASGEVLKEAKKINVSLLALENVIAALNKKNSKHIPYRDSKLVYILRNVFGGNSCTSVICNITESSYSAGESVSTLRFGERCQNVKNRPKVNQERSVGQLKRLLRTAEASIRQQDEQIKKLKTTVHKYGEIFKLLIPEDIYDEGDMNSALNRIKFACEANSHRKSSLTQRRKGSIVDILRKEKNEEYSHSLEYGGRSSGKEEEYGSSLGWCGEENVVYADERQSSCGEKVVFRMTAQQEKEWEEMKWANQVFKENLSQVPQQYICPIMQTIMTDPVIAADGHTYDRISIVDWLNRSQMSPMTGLALPTKELLPNYTLRSLIQSNPILRLMIDKCKIDEEAQEALNFEDIRLKRQEKQKDLTRRYGNGVFLFCSSRTKDSHIKRAFDTTTMF